MKKLLLVLALLPTMLLAQNNTWVRFQVQFDFYAPQESNFFMVNDSTGSQQFFYQPTQPYEVLDTVINMVSGFYTISLTDNFGDGWTSNQPASFKMGNTCQGDIILWDPVIGSFFQRDTTVNILPCAPPTPGCTDSNALNFNPTANVDDGSCIFPPCSGLSFTNAIATCDGGQAEIKWEWQTASSSPNCDVVGIHVQNGGYPLLWNSYWPAGLLHDFTTMAGSGQQAPGWTSDYYAVLEFVDGSFSDTIFQTVVACIPGCMDPTSISYNPWATFDNGLCAGAACPPDENDITLQITLDNWPVETGWHIVSGTDTVASFPEGTYDFNDIGLTYTYDFCVDTTTTFAFTVTDQYGDGLAGSTSGGTIDGQIVIYDCNGDTIWYLQNPAFGNSFTEDSLTSISCGGPITIDGCMDPAYQEYDSLANNNVQYLCITPHLQGCTDPAAFNYDPNATINQIVPFGDYTLTIEDDGGDGWLNSYIGIEQNGVLLGTYAMGPGSYEQSFDLDSILTSCILNVYYFEIKSQQTNPQQLQFQTMHNSFIIEDTILGNILMEEGTNPFANNGLGALQGFASPLWTVYSALPFFGDYCVPVVMGCMDSLSANYDTTANTDDGNCIPFILGCTNDFAFNYDSIANLDDGSCIPISYGCTDTAADNYNSLANTDDGSCYYIGCTDTLALNYDATATVNNGCVYPIYGCTDPLAFNYDATANVDNGSCLPIIFGCMDATAFNYDPLANTDNGSCVPVVFGCTDNTQFNYETLANTDNGSCIPYIYGCMDSTAFNFDVLANTDNGSCIPVVLGCTDTSAINYNPLANTEDGSCLGIIYGCTDPNYFNYNPLANTNDGSCIPFIYGCMDNTQFNFDPLVNTDDGNCIPIINGCTDNTQWNYDPAANTDNGSCLPYIFGCTDPLAFNYNLLANTDNGACAPFILGCTDSLAINYNLLANTDDGSCISPLYGCTDSLALNYNSLANTDDGSCIAIILGCMDPLSFNYNQLANVDNGSCIPFIYGCTDPTQFNYDASANTDDGNCIPYIYGCMDPLAFNYDANANTDNGSCFAIILGCMDQSALNYDILANTEYVPSNCILPVSGCTDVSAYNYDPLANTADSTACLYEAVGCVTGLGAPFGTGFWLNDGCFAWVIDVDNYCCTNTWDASCQSMYDYCQLGWPTAIEDISTLGIVVYPNPTTDIITIETRLSVEVEVYDIMGKLLINKYSKRIDLSDYPNGVYNLILIYNNKRFNTRVIKQ